MKEFKDYATMVVEEQKNLDALNKKREVAKQRYEERKRLRDEASYEFRMQKKQWEEENEDIIANVREHFTAEQIANKEYLQPSTQYRLRDITKDIEQEYELKNTRYHEDDKIDIIEHELNLIGNILESLNNRLDMLEGKPPYPYSKSFDA